MKRLALAAFVAVAAAIASLTAYYWAWSGSAPDDATVPVNSKTVHFEVSRSTAPTLGIVWAPSQKGYGEVKPTTIFNGGDPTGLVEHVRWQGWGKSRAIGIGTGWRPPENGGVSESRRTAARVVAWNLGMCRGRLAYRAVAWYFPTRGERFHPDAFINMCTGDYVRKDLVIGGLPSTIQTCAPPRGPGDRSVHSKNLRVKNISCKVGRRVALACTRFTYGDSGVCSAVGYQWRCTSTDPVAGSVQRCIAGRKSMSIHWLD